MSCLPRTHYVAQYGFAQNYCLHWCDGDTDASHHVWPHSVFLLLENSITHTHTRCQPQCLTEWLLMQELCVLVTCFTLEAQD